MRKFPQFLMGVLTAFVAIVVMAQINNPGLIVSGLVTPGNCVKFLSQFQVQDAGGICASGTTDNPQVSNYTAVAGDCGKTISLGGSAFFTLTVNAPAGYSAGCQIWVKNIDPNTGRGKVMTISGVTFPSQNSILWPTQSFLLAQLSGVWQILDYNPRWQISANPPTFNVDTALGNNTNDCLATGAGACTTLTNVTQKMCSALDIRVTGVKVQLTSGQTVGATVLCNWAGSQFDYQIAPTIVGDASATATCTANAANFLIDGAGGNAVQSVLVSQPWLFQGLKVQSAGGTSFQADLTSRMFLKNVRFGAANFGVRSFYTSQVEFVSGGCIDANQAGAWLNSQNVGQILIQPGNTIDIPNAATTINIVVQTKLSGYTGIANTTFTNAANCTVGQKWTADTGGGIDTGATPALLPCPTAGASTAPGYQS